MRTVEERAIAWCPSHEFTVPGKCCRNCLPIADVFRAVDAEDADALRAAERAGFDRAKAWAAKLVRTAVANLDGRIRSYSDSEAILVELADLIESLADESALDATPAAKG